MCCFIGALLAGSFLLKGWRAWHLRLPRAAVVTIAAGLVLAGGLAAWHLPHYAARAEARERTVLAEILAEPICRTRAGDGIVEGAEDVPRSPSPKSSYSGLPARSRSGFASAKAGLTRVSRATAPSLAP